MLWLKGTKSSLLGLALTLALGAFTASKAMAVHERPEGWKVRVTTHPVAPKQSLYQFTVRVRDEADRPVDDAAVSIRLHSFKEPGYRLVPARRAGKGNYRTTARIHEGVDAPFRARAVVESGVAR